MARRNGVETHFMVIIEDSGDNVEYIDFGSEDSNTIGQVLKTAGYNDETGLTTAPLREVIPFAAKDMPKIFVPLLDMHVNATNLTVGDGYLTLQPAYS